MKKFLYVRAVWHIMKLLRALLIEKEKTDMLLRLLEVACSALEEHKDETTLPFITKKLEIWRMK